MNEIDRFRFRQILPIGQLVLCILLLGPWRSFYILQFRAAVHVRWPIRSEKPVFYITKSLAPAPPQEDMVRKLAELRLATPALLNMPCAFAGLARPAAVPAGMLSVFWRSFSWPIVGLIFWWIVGRGIDASPAARLRVIAPAITGAETVVALLVTFGSAAGITVIIADPSVRSDLILPWRWALASLGLWSLLGLVTILARLAQWRVRRQKRSEAVGVTARE
jgi:hypothetical protein